MQEKKFVILDWDGTLCKHCFLVKAVFNLGFLLGIFRPNGNFCLSTTGTSIMLSPRLRQIASLKFARRLFEAIAISFFEKRKIVMVDGAEEVLKSLKEKGATLFVSSGSKTEAIEVFLKEAGLLSYFEVIAGRDIVPKSGQIHYFAEMVGLPWESFYPNAASIGDLPSDRIIAEKCGVLAVGVTNTVPAFYLKDAKIVVPTIAHLPNII